MDESVIPAAPGNKKLLIGIAVIAVVAVVAAGYFWYQASALKDDPQRVSREEATRLVAQISKLIVLPMDEEPVIATVSDPDKLKDQPFFAKAKVGDKVLIYNTAKKAILYSPAENRIVEVAPLNIGNE